MPVTYTDFNDVTRTETFYFHLSLSEMAELGFVGEDGMTKQLKRLLSQEDQSTIMALFKRIITTAIGERSPEGDKFYKNDRIREDFEACGAYEALFMKILTDPNALIEFILGIVPGELSSNPELRKQINKQMVDMNVQLPGGAIVPVAPVERTYDDYSRAELLEMPDEEFDRLVGTTDTKKMTKAQLSVLMARFTRGD